MDEINKSEIMSRDIMPALNEICDNLKTVIRLLENVFEIKPPKDNRTAYH